jgi:Fic family protein
MPWNWELPNWPKFTYIFDPIFELEKQFLLNVGSASVYLKTIDENEYNPFIIEVLCQEGIESSRIEGEILDRESLQSSLKKEFGLQASVKKGAEKETRMAKLLCSAYKSFDKPLDHEMLWQWHSMLFQNSSDIREIGKYRTHEEAMQIVSHRYDTQKVFFEAPPSKRVFQEMARFIAWVDSNESSKSILVKAAVAHIYFESIHPFEDGNGRIGRVLIEKILSQGVGRPLLMAFSKALEKRKKEYYSALEKCNRTLDVSHWVDFFAHVVLEAHQESMVLLSFLIEKTKMLQALRGKINPRQEKVLLRMFAEGPKGFQGGLSAEKYIAITKTTRATATRDLKGLVELGALEKVGTLRHTRYYLAHPLRNLSF